jgi:hypothetical protein
MKRIILTLVLSSLSFGANAALISRAGGAAYYDDVLNITWLADANYAKTSGFDDNDLLSWYEANDFIVELNNNSHIGIDTWRLPSMDVNGDDYIVKCSVATEIECRDSELGYMSVVYAAEPTNPLVFDNVLFNYWSSIDYDADNIDWPGGATCNAGSEGLCAWRQGFGFDSQNYVNKIYDGYSVWAVTQGDIANVVPIPAAVYLFASGLGLLGWFRRKA